MIENKNDSEYTVPIAYWSYMSDSYEFYDTELEFKTLEDAEKFQKEMLALPWQEYNGRENFKQCWMWDYYERYDYDIPEYCGREIPSYLNLWRTDGIFNNDFPIYKRSIIVSYEKL